MAADASVAVALRDDSKEVGGICTVHHDKVLHEEAVGHIPADWEAPGLEIKQVEHLRQR